MNTEDVRFKGERAQDAYADLLKQIAEVRAEQHESRRTSTSHELRLRAVENGLVTLVTEGELSTRPTPTATPTFTTTTWQDGFPFDPEELFGNVDDYPYQTRRAFVQVLTEDGERYVWPIMALGMRDHSGRLTDSEENRRKRGFHLWHGDRTGLGVWRDHQRNDSTLLIRDGRLLAYPLGVSPGELRAMPDPWTVDVTDRFKIGSIVELPDPETWQTGLPADFPTELAPGIVAHYPIQVRNGSSWNSPLQVAPVMVDSKGQAWISTNGDWWTVGKTGEDFKVEGDRIAMNGFDFTDAIRFGPEVRSIVEWPA